MKISSILERAVFYLEGGSFSCWAIEDAMEEFHYTDRSRPAAVSRLDMDERIEQDMAVINLGLDNMGLEKHNRGPDRFDEFPEGPERQYARALWLTWTALMAAEQGQ
jgi:hypothetical protein